MTNQKICSYLIFSIFILIYGCGQSFEPEFPDGEKDLNILETTTWVSLPEQKISGRMPDTMSWYTLKFNIQISSQHDFLSDKIFGGIHYFTYENKTWRGNYYFAGYVIDEDGTIILTSTVISTEIGVPVYENFSFAYISDWVISKNLLYLFYLSPFDEDTKMYQIIFEPLIDTHPVASHYSTDWYY